ncbi:hypothetical protein [Terriglobus sp.]|uniref:hypothetical protein n=1 Tax=Terriglobus sp. TaxID=1889013 RepID=UPI003B001DB2
MKKFLPFLLLSLCVPAAASAASLNLGATVGSVNKNLGITSSAIGAKPVIAAMQAPCVGGGPCINPAPCSSSPENPTALLAVLGATGLLVGRLGYGRMRNRNALATSVAA